VYAIENSGCSCKFAEAHVYRGSGEQHVGAREIKMVDLRLAQAAVYKPSRIIVISGKAQRRRINVEERDTHDWVAGLLHEFSERSGLVNRLQ
jgi:hypothetical protein